MARNRITRHVEHNNLQTKKLQIFPEKFVGGGFACKMGVAGYNDSEVNRHPEAVSDWSVPSHFGVLQVAQPFKWEIPVYGLELIPEYR
jgi:hypothetical protein